MNEEMPQKKFVTQAQFEEITALAGSAYQNAIPNILRQLAVELDIPTGGADDANLRQAIREGAAA
jgi:hypothetical protein